MNLKYYFIFTILSMSYLSHEVVYASSNNQSAKSIYNKMVSKYSIMKSYHDLGQATKELRVDGVIKIKEIKHFESYYISPKKYLLEWVSIDGITKPKYNAILFKDGNGYSWLDNEKVNKSNNIDGLLSSVVGVSDGISYIVPLFLMQSELCLSSTRIAKINIVNKGVLSGYNVYILDVTYTSGRKETLWVDSDNYILRKAEEKRKLSKNKDIIISILYKDIDVNKALKTETFTNKEKEFEEELSKTGN